MDFPLQVASNKSHRNTNDWWRKRSKLKIITRQRERGRRGGRDIAIAEKERTQCIEENTLRKRKGVPNSQANGVVNNGVHWCRLKKRRTYRAYLNKIGSSSKILVITLKQRRSGSRMDQ
jgi:hypothetical protein